jgi:hypothetical protein
MEQSVTVPPSDSSAKDSADELRRAAGQEVQKKAKAAKRPPFSLVMRVLAALIGALVLWAGYSLWRSPPDAQVAKTTIAGKEEIATKRTETTESGKTVVVTEPAAAVSGRSESVSIAFLLSGAIILFATALPDRNLSLKAAGVEAAITGTVAAAASKDAEKKAEGTQADESKVKAAGAIAAQQAATLLPLNFESARPGGLDRTLAAVSGGSLGSSLSPEALGKAAEDTIAQASAAALAQVL